MKVFFAPTISSMFFRIYIAPFYISGSLLDRAGTSALLSSNSSSVSCIEKLNSRSTA